MFLEEMLNNNLVMLIINTINCKRENATKAYICTLFIYNKSSTAGSIYVFEDLNVIQMRVDKTNSQWVEWLTI